MINFDILAQSIRCYDGYGYKRIESPWTVTTAVAKMTAPVTANLDDFFIPKRNKSLVASGEQSFLYLIVKGFLPSGRYQTVTPCFREDSFDLTHTKYFMKNELINTEDVSHDRLDEMVDHAYNFFRSYLASDSKLRKVKISINEVDIEYDGIEIGSYGIRHSKYFPSWIYGTGVAEPRFSSLIGEQWLDTTE